MTVFTQTMGEAFIQPGGAAPDNPVYSLGQCVTSDDVVEPSTSAEPIICLDKNGNYVQVGEMTSPPGKVTTGLTILSETVRSALEKQKCPYSLYLVQKSCKKKGTLDGFDLVTILANARNESKTYSNLVGKDTDNPSAMAASISAWFPVYRAVGASKLTVERIATTETQGLNDIYLNKDEDCGPNCTPSALCEHGAIAADSAAGPATANILFTDDFGAAWTAGAADPFGAGLHAMAVQRFEIPAGTIRTLVSQQGTGGAVQGHVAYSDDDGATWTVVNIGGAAAGHGATRGGGIFALDYNHIWLASASGYIYFSADGGATWTAQEAGVITAGDYAQVNFYNEYVGMAVAAADVVAFTRDGGLHWAAASATGGGNNLFTIDLVSAEKAWVGDSAGGLYYSDDLGLTWLQVTSFIGSGTDGIYDIDFVNEHVGWMTTTDGAPVGYIHRTVNGGLTWERLTNSVTNAGINALHACDMNNAFAVGEASGGTGVIYRAYEG